MYIKRKAGGQKQAGPRRHLLVVVVSPPRRWLMVVVPFMVGAVGWWWFCSWVVAHGHLWWCLCRHVGGAAGCSTLVVHVVISHRLPLVFDRRCSLFVVVHHCALFVSVVVIWRRFVSHGDMAADVSGGLPIGEG